MKKSIIMFFVGLGIVCIIMLIYYLIYHSTGKPINKVFFLPIYTYMVEFIGSKLNCRVLPKTISEISKFLALVFFSFVTMFEIFESSDIRNSFCLIIVISIIFNWNTSVENKNDKEGSR